MSWRVPSGPQWCPRCKEVVEEIYLPTAAYAHYDWDDKAKEWRWTEDTSGEDVEGPPFCAACDTETEEPKKHKGAPA